MPEEVLSKIGNRLFRLRRERSLTQAQIAESAGISDRAYADIERGTANMRVESLLGICSALQCTPNDILLDTEKNKEFTEEDLRNMLKSCTEKQKEIALKIIQVCLETV